MIKHMSLSITFAVMIAASLTIGNAYAFDSSLVNINVTQAQITQFETYDVLTAIFSLFNADTEPMVLFEHNMLYLNDTAGDYWEYATHTDLEGFSEQDCPDLFSIINPGETNQVTLCYIVSNEANSTYSLVLNSDYYYKDFDTQQVPLEFVPDWFKSTAGFWCDGLITDADYTNSLEFQIQNGQIQAITTSIDTNTPQVPQWVRDSACSWSQSTISDYEYLNGVAWLIDNGHIVP